jgi:hypothetical protein
MRTKTTLKSGSLFLRVIPGLVFWLLLSQASLGQNFTSYLSETWTGTAWENAAQAINTFDGSNHVTNTLAQTWQVPTSQWQNAFQVNYTNNPNGTVGQSISQSWNTGSSAWENAARTTYTYNASSQVATSISDIWTGVWMAYTKETNTYGGGYLTNTVIQTWDFLSSSWVNSTQIAYTNNANGTVSQSVSQAWNTVSSTWTNQSRSTFTYANNKILSELSETWTGSAWVNNDRDNYTYDGSGYLTKAVNQIWVTASSLWQNDSQSLFTNDAGGNPTQIIGQSWVSGDVWENVSRITFTYTLGVDDFNQRAFSLSPNPAANTITIKTNDDLSGQAYNITDEMGRYVQSGVLNPEETNVDVNALNAGLYFFQIGTSRLKAKMIKK